MSLHSPQSPSHSKKATCGIQESAQDLLSKTSGDLLTPPPTNSSSPLNKETLLPNNFKYYTKHLNKNQFNTILINCSINLMKILYHDEAEFRLPMDEKELKFFVVEILRRSKTSIQTLQLTCYYLVSLIKSTDSISKDPMLKNPKKLFLGLLILASKFNQDYNYSFKSWLKICGVAEQGASNADGFNVQVLRQIEIKCLAALNYDTYLNGLNYENWCNILVIFGYDFIKFQLINNSTNNIYWELNDVKLQNKMQKWYRFFHDNLKVHNLKMIKVNFNNYYLNQVGKKILIQKKPTASVPSLFGQTSQATSTCGKRSIEDAETTANKKVCT